MLPKRLFIVARTSAIQDAADRLAHSYIKTKNSLGSWCASRKTSYLSVKAIVWQFDTVIWTYSRLHAILQYGNSQAKEAGSKRYHRAVDARAPAEWNSHKKAAKADILRNLQESTWLDPATWTWWEKANIIKKTFAWRSALKVEFYCI